jgi:hypothetical protein
MELKKTFRPFSRPSHHVHPTPTRSLKVSSPPPPFHADIKAAPALPTFHRPRSAILWLNRTFDPSIDHLEREVLGVLPRPWIRTTRRCSPLMYEEADASGDDDDHLMIISCLFGLYARECKAVSWGYESGALKSKSMHRLEGYCMLYTDYFTDDL